MQNLKMVALTQPAAGSAGADRLMRNRPDLAVIDATLYQYE